MSGDRTLALTLHISTGNGGVDQGGASARLSEVKNESRRDFTPTPH